MYVCMYVCVCMYVQVVVSLGRWVDGRDSMVLGAGRQYF